MNISSNSALPTPVELVKSMVQQERGEHVDREQKEKSYLEIETSIRDNPEQIPKWEVAGPLNYSMTLPQMKNVIESKFREMASSGQMMSEKSYYQQRSHTNYYPCGSKTGTETKFKGDTDLTRIWGANYLKSHLINDATLKAADHFLIVKEGATELIVEVWHGKSTPYLSIIKNAYIVSKKIEGDRCASLYSSSPILDQLRYRDFTDPGNIRQDSNGVGWIVDTEMKSFEESPAIEGKAYATQEYLKNRFKFLSGNEYHRHCQIFPISLSEFSSNFN